MGFRSHCSIHTTNNKVSRQKTQKLFLDLSKKLNLAVNPALFFPMDSLSFPFSFLCVSSQKPRNISHLGPPRATLVYSRVLTGASPPTIPPFPRDFAKPWCEPSFPPYCGPFSPSPLHQRRTVTRQPTTHQIRDSQAETENLNFPMGENHKQRLP